MQNRGWLKQRVRKYGDILEIKATICIVLMYEPTGVEAYVMQDKEDSETRDILVS